MDAQRIATLRRRLLAEREQLAERIGRIHAHAREPLDADSGEQAAELGNVEVTSALEAEATAEIAAIDAALARMDAGRFGICVDCGEPIAPARLEAAPAAVRCTRCAEAAPS